MGVDLTLLVAKCFKEDEQWGFAHTIIALDRDRGLWGKVSDLCSYELTEDWNFTSFMSNDVEGIECYGKMFKTPYDTPIAFVKPRELGDCIIKYYGENKYKSLVNVAVAQYLQALPDHYRIGLYWH